MLITKEVDYAIRILRALSDGRQRTVGSITSEQFIPQQFAYKIVKKLNRAGLISISRGAEGGCRLEADLKKTSLYDLMEAMEEELEISTCMKTGYCCPWREKNTFCQVHSRLRLVQERLNAELRSHTLDSLIFGS